MIVNFRDYTYDEIKAFFATLYANFNVLRKNITVGNRFCGRYNYMKNFLKKTIVIFVLMFSVSFLFVGCNTVSDEVVRIHIRANSNSEFDQSVKLKVRDVVVEYITPKLDSCNDCQEVKAVLNDNLKNIELVADSVLKENGCNYISSASIDNEYFPSRDYDGISFPADYYDAVIIRLGSGVGDNWWCVAYPPLCFVSNSTDKIEYKSKLVEIIRNSFS